VDRKQRSLTLIGYAPFEPTRSHDSKKRYVSHVEFVCPWLEIRDSNSFHDQQKYRSMPFSPYQVIWDFNAIDHQIRIRACRVVRRTSCICVLLLTTSYPSHPRSLTHWGRLGNEPPAKFLGFVTVVIISALSPLVTFLLKLLCSPSFSTPSPSNQAVVSSASLARQPHILPAIC
jgi:hypothetical protein